MSRIAAWLASFRAVLRWDLVQVARGDAGQITVTLVAFASAGLVGLGIVILSLWSPFTLTSTPTFGNRPDPNASQLVPLLGGYRGGVAFLVILLWLLLLAMAIGPAFAAGAIVRDRRSGRLDRILLDSSRADAVVAAKLFTALVPLGATLLVAGPAASFAWLIGGVATRDAIADALVLAAIVVLIAAIGLACSAIASTETAGVLASYCVAAGVILAPLAVAGGLAVAGYSKAAVGVLSFDPIVALLAGQPALMWSFVHLSSDIWATTPIIWAIDVAPIKVVLPVWAVDAVLYAALAAALVWLTGVVLEPLHPLKTSRLRRQAGGIRYQENPA